MEKRLKRMQQLNCGMYRSWLAYYYAMDFDDDRFSAMYAEMLGQKFGSDPWVVDRASEISQDDLQKVHLSPGDQRWWGQVLLLFVTQAIVST